MKFSLSEYTVVEKVTEAVDPLGLMRPFRDLRDRLFPQFTVLTQRPAYFGLLCALWEMLEEEGATRQPQSARRFRELELLWGLAVTHAGDQPLNVTKFDRMLEQGLPMALTPQVSRGPLLKKLAYGTLGHYSRPAATWGLIQGRNPTLTAAGRDLARGFRRRGRGHDLHQLLQRWSQGAGFDADQLQHIGQRFGVNADPSPAEAQTWRDLIAAQSRTPRAVLWSQPLEPSFIRLLEQDGEGRQQAWNEILRRYVQQQATLDACYRFERVTAALQLIFLHRLAREEYEGWVTEPPRVLRHLATAVYALARECDGSPRDGLDMGELIAAVASGPADLEGLEQRMITHHMAHHQAKGVSAFITHAGVQVRGRVSRADIGKIVESLATVEETDARFALDAVQFAMRRDWHFARCERWCAFASSNAEVAA